MREIKFRAWDKCRKEYLSGGNVFIGINPGVRPLDSPIYLDMIDLPNHHKERFILEQYTGLKDIHGTDIYEGDIIESHLEGQILAENMVVKYGTHQGYCPVDRQDMDSVGFYVSVPGLPDMPLGPTEDYAKVVGNIHENPFQFFIKTEI